MRAMLLALPALFLAACAEGGTDAATLFPSGTEWNIAAIEGEAVPADIHASITREGDHVSGSSGCNRFAGGITLSGERLSFGALAGTRMACADPAMEVESALHAAFGRVDGIRAGADGALELTAGGEAAVTLIPAPPAE